MLIKNPMQEPFLATVTELIRTGVRVPSIYSNVVLYKLIIPPFGRFSLPADDYKDSVKPPPPYKSSYNIRLALMGYYWFIYQFRHFYT